MTQLQTEQGIVRVPTGTRTVDPIHSSVGFEGSSNSSSGTLEAASRSRRVWTSPAVRT